MRPRAGGSTGIQLMRESVDTDIGGGKWAHLNRSRLSSQDDGPGDPAGAAERRLRDIVIFFRLCSDDRVKAKIYANMSSRAGRYIRQESSGRERQPGHDGSARSVTATLRAARGEQSPPVIDRYDTATCTISSISWRGSPEGTVDSVLARTRQGQARLLRDGLRVIARKRTRSAWRSNSRPLPKPARRGGATRRQAGEDWLGMISTARSTRA